MLLKLCDRALRACVSRGADRAARAGLAGGVGLTWFVAALMFGATACSSQPDAPSDPGVCWRMFDEAGPSPSFEELARDVPNLESCAALLEGARMLEGVPTAGAYNGHFIFATEEQITSASSLDGARIRIFEAGDRRKIQEGLRTLIDQQPAPRLPAT